MGNIAWTKSWSASDNGTIFGGADLQNIQNDITTVINGGLSNSNVASDAAIVESKIAFNTSTGHNHDGSNSKAVAPLRHFITGCELVYNNAGTFDVADGMIDVGGTLVTLTGTSGLSNIDLAVGGNWIDSDSEGASEWIYVYIDSSGNLKIGNTAPQDDYTTDGTSDWQVQRYHTSGGTAYRCIGAVRNDSSQDIVKFYQDGNAIYYNERQEILNDGGATTYTAVDMSAAIPAFSTEANLNIGAGNDSSNIEYLYISCDGGTTDTYVSGHMRAGADAVNEGIGWGMWLHCPSQTVHYKITGGLDAWIQVLGYRVAVR